MSRKKQQKATRNTRAAIECKGNYSATYDVGILAVDGWAVTFGTAKRWLGVATARPGPYSLYQMFQM